MKVNLRAIVMVRSVTRAVNSMIQMLISDMLTAIGFWGHVLKTRKGTVKMQFIQCFDISFHRTLYRTYFVERAP